MLKVWLMSGVILKMLLMLVGTIAGWVLVPIALGVAALYKSLTFPYLLWAWDNDRDHNGDGGFQNEHCPRYGLKFGGFWCNYIWYAFRNPCANLAWWLGVNEIITDLDIQGNWSIAYGESGRRYILYHLKNNKVEFYIGYKNDNVKVGELVPYNIGIAFRVNLAALTKGE